jgi:hypothetical protein
METLPIKLARWVENDVSTLTILRDLTPGELSSHKHYQPLTGAAMERLELFKLLAHNYQEWKTYIESLLCAQPLGDEDAKLNLNRLLLNYLTCAYTIRKDQDGFDLISDRLRHGPIWYAGPDAVRNAVAYAKYLSSSRSHKAIVCVFDESGSVIQTV